MSGQNETISLTVEKSIPSDVGHGRARISGDSGLDLKPGDIVLIKGEKALHCCHLLAKSP